MNNFHLMEVHQSRVWLFRVFARQKLQEGRGLDGFKSNASNETLGDSLFDVGEQLYES